MFVLMGVSDEPIAFRVDLFGNDLTLFPTETV